jgi:hypothetical protein
MVGTDWWLEGPKLGIAVLTPVTVVVVGFLLDRRSSRNARLMESRMFADQTLTQRRIDVYDELKQNLNMVYCYVRQVGEWKSWSPEAVLTAKRRADREMKMHALYFTPEQNQLYDDFMTCCYKMFGGHGTSAKLRVAADGYRVTDGWDESWVDYFAEPAEAVSRDEVQRCYERLVQNFVFHVKG